MPGIASPPLGEVKAITAPAVGAASHGCLRRRLHQGRRWGRAPRCASWSVAATAGPALESYWERARVRVLSLGRTVAGQQTDRGEDGVGGRNCIPCAARHETRRRQRAATGHNLEGVGETERRLVRGPPARGAARANSSRTPPPGGAVLRRAGSCGVCPRPGPRRRRSGIVRCHTARNPPRPSDRSGREGHRLRRAGRVGRRSTAELGASVCALRGDYREEFMRSPHSGHRKRVVPPLQLDADLLFRTDPPRITTAAALPIPPSHHAGSNPGFWR